MKALWSQLSPATYRDVITSQTKALSGIKREAGDEYVKALISYAIVDLVEFFNVGKSMSEAQVVQTVNLILETYILYKPEDFALCFKKAKMGAFGKVYDRIDGAVILEWLAAYDQGRTEFAVEIQMEKHRPHQAAYMNSRHDRELSASKDVEVISKIKSDSYANRLRNEKVDRQG